jgi:hypothetical protein
MNKADFVDRSQVDLRQLTDYEFGVFLDLYHKGKTRDELKYGDRFERRAFANFNRRGIEFRQSMSDRGTVISLKRRKGELDKMDIQQMINYVESNYTGWTLTQIKEDDSLFGNKLSRTLFGNERLVDILKDRGIILSRSENLPYSPSKKRVIWATHSPGFKRHLGYDVGDFGNVTCRYMTRPRLPASDSVL